MPIRREFRKFYQAEWRAYRLVLIARADFRCAICGTELPSNRLAAAHITHDPRSSEVRVLCFSCHSRHDAAHSRAVARRTIAKHYGQAWLWPEVAVACFPTWLIPKRVLEMQKPRQGELWAA